MLTEYKQAQEWKHALKILILETSKEKFNLKEIKSALKLLVTFIFKGSVKQTFGHSLVNKNYIVAIFELKFTIPTIVFCE